MRETLGGSAGRFGAARPVPDVSRFSSSVPALDAWLHCKARLNETRGGARTHVACDGDRVAGCYSLAASSVERRHVSSRVGCRFPEPIPVILLGQLAVDTGHQGRRLPGPLRQMHREARQ